MRGAGRRSVRAGTAGTACLLWLLMAGNLGVEEQIAAFRYIHAVFLYIAVCIRLRAHALQSAFHTTGHK